MSSRGISPTVLATAVRHEHNSNECRDQGGVPTEYHVLKGKKHYDVYKGRPLDDVMKLEIAWFDKYLKGKK